LVYSKIIYNKKKMRRESVLYLLRRSKSLFQRKSQHSLLFSTTTLDSRFVCFFVSLNAWISFTIRNSLCFLLMRLLEDARQCKVVLHWHPMSILYYAKSQDIMRLRPCLDKQLICSLYCTSTYYNKLLCISYFYNKLWNKVKLFWYML